jgi:hypothetical protein
MEVWVGLSVILVVGYLVLRRPAMPRSETPGTTIEVSTSGSHVWWAPEEHGWGQSASPRGRSRAVSRSSMPARLAEVQGAAETRRLETAGIAGETAEARERAWALAAGRPGLSAAAGDYWIERDRGIPGRWGPPRPPAG